VCDKIRSCKNSCHCRAGTRGHIGGSISWICASCRRKASNHYQGTGWHCMNSSHGFGVTPISRLDDKAISHQLTHQAKSLIDALLPFWRLIGDCGHAPQFSRGQRIRYLNGSGNPLPILAMLSGLSKNFGSFDIRLASHPFISHRIACEAVQICASWTFSLPEDTRHSPIREWLRLGADFSARRILSRALQEQKAPILRGY